jgi:hypothetical protein
MMVAMTTTSLAFAPVRGTEPPRHLRELKNQVAEAPNCLLLLYYSPKSLVLLFEVPKSLLLLFEAQHRSKRHFGASELRHLVLRHFGASALRCFGASVLWCFGASALRRFGASVPRRGARARYVAVVATIMMVPRAV